MKRILFALCIIAGTVRAQTIAPGDNLVLDGIPPVPASVAEAVGRYEEFRAASFLSWHPVNHHMLVRTRFADAPQVHLVKMPGGARTQLTFYDERISGAAYNPADGSSYLFTKDVGGGEWYQIYRCDAATGLTEMLTDGKSRNGLGPWSLDGKRIAYTSTRRTGKDTDIYTMDPADSSTNRLLLQVEGGGWSPSAWSPDGTTLLVTEFLSINESYLWLVNAATGAKTLLTPKNGEQVSSRSARFSRDGKGIYLTTDRESEFQRLAYIDLATGRTTYLTTHIRWDVNDFDQTHDGSTIAFVANEDGAGTLHLLATATGAEEAVKGLPPGGIGGVEWHRDGSLLAFTMSSARSPSDVYAFRAADRTVERWTESETGGIDVRKFSEAEIVKWKSFDGRTISGFLYRPPARFAGKRPVIVNIHGGPEGQATAGFLGRNNYYLNELGIAVVFPNIRGSSGYGKTFLKLDNGFKREDSYKDLGALLDWIKTQPDLDGDRIMVTGGSYGGHSTLAVATFYSDKIRCAVDVVGMSNLVTFLERTESYRRDLRRVEYGDERDAKMRAFLDSIAPLKNVRNIKKPLFVVQGKNDPRVPVTEADQIVAALKQQETPVWYLMATDEGHGFAKKKNQDFQFYATLLFMEKYLLN